MKIQTTLESNISTCHRTLFSDYYDQTLTKLSADITLVCGLNFQVECQDKLRVNSDADKALANELAEVSKELLHNHFISIFIFY